MSVVRFLHTDALRLGSPVVGLADSPDWLRNVTSSAVRTAVTNVIEAAVAGRCQLLLIAGRLTESDQDLEPAITWLKTQTGVLREHGVRLVLAGYSEADHAALRPLDAILVAPGQRLDVRSDAADRMECVVSPRTIVARPGSLGIEVGGQMTVRPQADLAYIAIPAMHSSAMTNSFDGVVSAHDRHLRISAGCPQAVNPSERGVFGCQLVEADLSHQTLTARFCSTDAVRFAQELVTCPSGTPAAQLFDLLRERSRSLDTTGRCTIIVEWVVAGQLALSPTGTDSLEESTLLKDLRGSLHGGHSGAWPCRIRFSENCTLDVSGHRSAAAQEFTSVVRTRCRRFEDRILVSDHGAIGIPLGCGSEAALGLELLRRVA